MSRQASAPAPAPAPGGPVAGAAAAPQGAATAPPAVVLLDTCVLISNVLRRLLLHLARQGCLQPAWSRVIGDEWRRNAARLWGVPADEVAAQWQALQLDFPQADLGEVEAFKEGLRYSDPKDWHVVAAGRAALARWPGQSAAVLTRNLKDFDRRELRGLGLQLYDPDRYLEQCWAAYGGPLRCALNLLAQDLAQIEGAPPLDDVLGRESLYRLRKLWRRHVEQEPAGQEQAQSEQAGQGLAGQEVKQERAKQEQPTQEQSKQEQSRGRP